MYNDLNLNFKLPNSKLIKINNPVDFNYISSKNEEKIENNFLDKSIILLAVGRLTYQKVLIY